MAKAIAKETKQQNRSANSGNLGSDLDTNHPNAAAAPKLAFRARRFRWVVDAALPLALMVVAAIAVLLPTTLPASARLTLFMFMVATILWATTAINAAYVALGTMLLMVLTGGSSQEQLFDALGSDVVWLMIGAFVIGGAVQNTGLALRLTQWVMARSQTVGGVCWLLTTVLIPLAFVIPSTSGRAAVAIPVFRSIAEATGDRRMTRALALLIPTVILVSTIVALVGAGSHLIANDLLHQIAQTQLSFGQWALYGVPFGVVASYSSCWVIMRLFLGPSLCRRPLHLPVAQPKPFSIAEWKTLLIVALMIGLWLTERWHGLEIATVAVLGALLLTLPGWGVLPWKEGLKSVSWNLIIFVGAALGLGHALIDSGAAKWIIDQLFVISSITGLRSQPFALIVLAFISLTSHLYMTSHSARAVALVPALLYLGSSLQLNPVAVLFISTVGMDYCLTFPVSSKALLMFQELDESTYKPTDLLKLSAVLIPIHLGLMVLFYYGYWRWVGLAL